MKEYMHIKPKRTKEPLGCVIAIAPFQDSVKVNLCCICCAYRWGDLIAASMLKRPQWSGILSCPGCGVHGHVVRL